MRLESRVGVVARNGEDRRRPGEKLREAEAETRNQRSLSNSQN